MKPAIQFGRKVRLAWFLAGVFAASTLYLMLGVTGSHPARTHDLYAEVASLSRRVRQSESRPTASLLRQRESVCLIFGVYSYRTASAPQKRRRGEFFGTGFVVAEGMIATNRHVVEPTFDPSRTQVPVRLMPSGSEIDIQLESLEAYFPGLPQALPLHISRVSEDADLAVVQFDTRALARPLTPLAISLVGASPGDSVTVVGYPLGLDGVLAKTPRPLYHRLMQQSDDQKVAAELAAQSLIRPTSTSGHLGDVVGDFLVFDASTARGGSGGPVFNAEGKVIGITTGLMKGFSDGTVGISAQSLRGLMKQPR